MFAIIKGNVLIFKHQENRNNKVAEKIIKVYFLIKIKRKQKIEKTRATKKERNQKILKIYLSKIKDSYFKQNSIKVKTRLLQYI